MTSPPDEPWWPSSRTSPLSSRSSSMRLPRNTPSGHPGIPGSPISATGTVTEPRSSRSSSSDPLQGAREGALVRIRARVEYDGTDFAGFQLQLRARTVQGELEAALGTLSGGRRVRVDAAGRTDAGVHATVQLNAITWPVAC